MEISLAVRTQVQTRIPKIIKPLEITTCINCKSQNIRKSGVRHNKSGDIQRMICYDCNKTFSINIGFEYMKHNPQAITTAMQLYFSGESLRNVAKSLKLLGTEVSHQTVFYWIKKYTSILQSYSDSLKPQVGDTWRADELYLKVKGNQKYLYALMDDETRFWISQEVANTKYTEDLQGLFTESKVMMGKKPKTLITDGARNFHDAYLREFWTNKKETRTEHISHIHLKGDMNNNKMERMNGEIRDREKVMRGLKKKDTPILKGYQVFHNYFRPHQGLNGKTPAEACGIKIIGDNKWITMIQNAENQ